MSPIVRHLVRVGVALTLAVVLLLPEGASAVRPGVRVPVSLADADAKLAGDTPGAEAGFRVQAVGDLDGDGSDDLAVGAWRDDSTGAADAGAVYVVYGPVSGDLRLADAAKLTGEAAADFAGETLAGPADVDGDGYDDLIVGAPGPIPGQGDLRPGKTYVVYGGMTRLSGTHPLARVAGATFVGEIEMDNVGLGLEADDFDLDGVDDLVIAGPGWSGVTGKVWVVYGSRTRFTGAVGLANVAAAQFVGEHPGSATGFSVAGGDDLDGDGRQDLVIGAQAWGASNGAAYVVYGRNGRFSGTNSLAVTSVRLAGEQSGDLAGTSVATGDLDGDGRAELVVGAPEAFPPAALTGAGSTYVFYGGRRPLSGTLATADVILAGEAVGDGAGIVAVVPDGSSDGRGRLVVGAIGHDGGAPDSGAIYVTSLTSKGRRLTGHVSLATAKDKFVGEAAGDTAGRSPAAGLDADRDGVGDLLVGAEKQDEGGPDAGAAYLVFGHHRSARPGR